jgi:hypothetical protein
MKKLAVLVILAASLGVVATAARAIEVFDNGSTDLDTGLIFSGGPAFAWEDFVLQDSTGFTSVNFSTLEIPTAVFDPDWVYFIQPDAGGLPGNPPIAAGIGEVVDRTFMGTGNLGEFWENTLELSTPVDGLLPGTTYWLGLLGPGSAGVFWSTTADGYGSHAVLFVPSAENPLIPTNADLAFRLMDSRIPLPPTALLLALGVGALVTQRAHRRRQPA